MMMVYTKEPNIPLSIVRAGKMQCGDNAAILHDWSMLNIFWIIDEFPGQYSYIHSPHIRIIPNISSLTSIHLQLRIYNLSTLDLIKFGLVGMV